MKTTANLIADATAQEAYGIWNTAPLHNRIARLEAAARSPLHNLLRKWIGRAFVALAYLPLAIIIVTMFARG